MSASIDRPSLTQYAGFWRRGVASLLDEAVTTTASFLLMFPLAWMIQAGGGELTDALRNFYAIVLGFFVSIPYTVILTKRYGYTPGKWMLGVIVVTHRTKEALTWKQSALRYFGQIVSMLPLGAGYLMVAWNPEKRALHDLISGTICYRFRC